MNSRVLIWPAAGVTSLTLHAAFLAGLVVLLQPRHVPPQSMPETSISIAAHPVDRVTAPERDAKGEAVAASAAAATGLAGASVPSTTASSAPVNATVVQPVQPEGMTLAAQDGALPAPALLPDAVALAADKKPSAQVATLRPAAEIAAHLPAPVSEAVDASDRLPAEPVLSGRAAGTALAALGLPAETAPALPSPAMAVTAGLAWSRPDAETVDPLSLAAFQAFTEPGDISRTDSNAGRVRDGVTAALASVPCARLQTVFDPETGLLELRGHVPDGALRAPVVAALRAEIGDAIPISDRLLILPRPQCTALTGIAATGLAQSTEQATDPRVIGPDAFVRDYRFAEGDRMILDLKAPDYPSFIYVDYFDANGNVLHLQPNETVPLEQVAPKSALAVGKPRADGAALDITISPPFGQEIAVAFAASDPLYSGLRPIVEPAGPYLEFLRQAVAARRASAQDFKGEWVYFFVTTTAR
ncbi:MAG: DUF4384 domain-containing protein [Rhodobacteraceae bacterium]|nr:DUF4384 domain-containing protein [Paracoccaceae bacterium]